MLEGLPRPYTNLQITIHISVECFDVETNKSFFHPPKYLMTKIMIISLYDQDHLNNERELVSFPLARKDGLPCEKLGNNAPEALIRARCIIVFDSGTQL